LAEPISNYNDDDYSDDDDDDDDDNDNDINIDYDNLHRIVLGQFLMP